MATKKKPTNTVKLSPPWYILRNKIYNLLGADEELIISELEESETKKGSYVVTISSQNDAKLEALKKIMISHFEFGNISVDVDFEYIRDEDDEVTIEDYETAFEGNPYFVQAVETGKGMFQGIKYIVFAKEILQFFDDDLTDLYSNMSIIVADAVKDVCKKYNNVNFCTDDPDAHK